jgi:anaerobic selenocysteine-containing dehydrogenase
MSQKTACPLDCYDACEISFKTGLIKAVKGGHTKGFLCPHLNHYENYNTISVPRYRGKEISLDEALLKLKEMIKLSKKDEILHYRSSGNFGLMQEVMDHFFASYGAVLTDGTLCDGAGEAGIVEGRGSNKNMPLSEIEKSEVVIIWGRNPHATSSHLLPLLKGKKIIVIDPVKTKIAKMADLYIQIKPHGDLYLAMLLTRFLYIYDSCDEEYLAEYASEFEDYYELTQSIRIKATLDEIDVTLGDVGDIMDLIKDKKVAIVCGLGIQKYSDGADVMRAIDAFGVALGLFAKEGCGVAYLGDSKEGIESAFFTKSKRVSKVDTEFSNFKTVFIQCANLLSQMPDTLRVKESISKVENLVYFGLYENETSEVADLIIPAKSFLYKNDIRTSYSHNAMVSMNRVKSTDVGISEYDLSSYLCDEFDIKLESEEFYIEHFKNFSIENIDETWHVQNRENIPYKNGFDTDDGEFLFLEEFEKISYKSKQLFLITSKSENSLNSQFKREKNVYINSSHNFVDGDLVLISSACGSVELSVRIDENLRDDCVLIYSGTAGVNNLTTSKHSYDGKCAIFQEQRVEISKVLK